MWSESGSVPEFWAVGIWNKKLLGLTSTAFFSLVRFSQSPLPVSFLQNRSIHHAFEISQNRNLWGIQSVYIYTYTYYIYIYAYIYMHVYIYVYVNLYIYMHLYLCKSIYIYVNLSIYIHIMSICQYYFDKTSVIHYLQAFSSFPVLGSLARNHHLAPHPCLIHPAPKTSESTHRFTSSRW